MENHLEIEFKNVLTKDEFIRLQQFLGITENDFFLQVNDYFDTDDFALKKPVALSESEQKRAVWSLH